MAEMDAAEIVISFIHYIVYFTYSHVLIQSDLQVWRNSNTVALGVMVFLAVLGFKLKPMQPLEQIH